MAKIRQETQFFLCPVDRFDDENGDCFALTSCGVPDQEIDKEVAKFPESRLKEEFQMVTLSSYASQIKSMEYLDELLALLKRLDKKNACTLVTRVEFSKEDNRTVTVNVQFSNKDKAKKNDVTEKEIRAQLIPGAETRKKEDSITLNPKGHGEGKRKD